MNVLQLFITGFAVVFLSMPVSAYASNANVNSGKIRENSFLNIKPNTWIKIPGTKLKNVVGPESYSPAIKVIVGPAGIIEAWNGAVWNESEQQLDIIAAGGHWDYCGNEHYRFDLDDMKWKRLIPPSSMKGYDWKTGKTPDGRPASRHTYQAQVYVPTNNKTYMFGGSLCSKSGAADNKIWSFDKKGRAKLLGELKAYPSLGGHALYDPQSGYIFLVKRGHVYQYNIKTNTIRDLTKREGDYAWGTSAAIDVRRRIIFAFGDGYAWTFDLKSGKKRKVKLSGDYSLIKRVGIGMVYVKSIDRYVLWAGGNTMYFVNPETFEFAALETKGKAPKGNKNGVYGRFRYSEKYAGFIVVSRLNEDVYFLKLGAFPKQGDKNLHFSTANPQKIIDSALSGNTVTIEPGTYLSGLRITKAMVLNLKNVNLWGVSGNKAILNIENPDGPVIINDFTATGQKANAVRGNLAGIKVTGKNFDVTINRADISGTVMGILTDNRGGILRINDSYIHDTGNSDIKSALSHIVYAGKIDKIQVVNSTIARSYAQGHIFKTRALETSIENSRLLGGNSRHGRIIDMPCGGILTVSNVEMKQSPRADNLDLMGFGMESCGANKAIKVTITGSSITATKSGSVLYSLKGDKKRANISINRATNSIKGVKPL